MGIAGMDVPPGILLLQRFQKQPWGFRSFQDSVLVLTFLSYACFHASRKPPSIVKSVLNMAEHRKLPDNLTGIPWHPAAATSLFPANYSDLNPDIGSALINSSSETLGGLKHGWAPFTGNVGKGLLGEMDVAFLSCYAVGMYFAGHVGDRMDLRIFLSLGMAGSGICVCLFGMAYFMDVHVLGYFLIIQMAGGFFQAVGWPTVVSAMANWYGKKQRGLIMGVWNAHTSVGNICGSLVASFALSWGWGWSFLLPGIAMVLMGATIFLFLVPEPEIVGHRRPGESDGEEMTDAEDSKGGVSSSSLKWELEASKGLTGGGEEKEEKGTEKVGLDDEARKLLEGSVPSHRGNEEEVPIGFLEAWKIPGVAAFASCLFFAKLVAYTFLYWLPFYIGHTEIDGKYMSSAMAGITSTVFDIGGVFGGILAGHLSDSYRAQATVASTFMGLAIPSMGIYFLFGHVSVTMNIALLALVGFLVNGPYALITCAVSADLGQHSSLKGNARALATVTAIIDGTGSVGAAIGPFLTGLISEIGGEAGWAAVFGMLMLACLMSVLCLVRLVKHELEHLQVWRLAVEEERRDEFGEPHIRSPSIVEDAHKTFVCNKV